MRAGAGAWSPASLVEVFCGGAGSSRRGTSLQRAGAFAGERRDCPCACWQTLAARLRASRSGDTVPAACDVAHQEPGAWAAGVTWERGCSQRAPHQTPRWVCSVASPGLQNHAGSLLVTKCPCQVCF